MNDEIVDDEPEVPYYKRSSFRYLTIACIALVSTAVGAFFYTNHSTFENVAYAKNDIGPGRTRATLVLKDGSKIELTDSTHREVEEPAGRNLIRVNYGELIYQAPLENDSTHVKKGAPIYNILITPRGGQYKLRLPDGTRVWLNAASSIRYSDHFTGKERRVELKGEAYFEVEKADSIPFIVKSKEQEVMALGTRFNINNYADEEITQTTLLEGSVEVFNLKNGTNAMDRDAGILLHPGDQSNFTVKGIEVRKADPEEVVSWKNGYFQFKEVELKHVMHEMSRWYNVDVVYEGEIPNVKFTGEIRRDVNVSAFLEMLAYLKVRFKIKKNDNGKNEVIVRQLTK